MKYLKASVVVLILLVSCAIGYAQQGYNQSPGYSSTGQYCSGGCCVQIVLAPNDPWQSDDYSGFKVTLKQIGGTYTTCASDPDGTIEFNDVPPGYYWLNVCYSPSSYSSSYSQYGTSQGQYPQGQICYYENRCICVFRDYYDSGTQAGSDPCSNQYYIHPVNYDCSKDLYKTKFCCKGCPDCQQYTPSYQQPGYQQTGYSQQTGKPTIKIISPVNNANVPSGDIPITVQVENFNLVNKLGQASVPGEGHIHYYLDAPLSALSGGNPSLYTGTFMPTPDTTFTWKNVAPGTHTFSVLLSNNDHTPVVPLAIDQVTVTVQ